MCVTILTITVIEKFTAGGWITLTVTAALIAACYGIRRHYQSVGVRVRKLDDELIPLEQTPDIAPDEPGEMDPAAPTAGSDHIIGIEAVTELEQLAREVHLRFPRSVFFAGQLVFQKPSPLDRLLHDMTAFAVQRRLQFDNLPMVVLPVRVR